MNQTLLPVIQLQVRYHSWAIREMWRGVSALPTTELTLPKGTSFDTLQATLTHMYTADRVWMNRLSGVGNAQMMAIEPPRSGLLEDVWGSTLDEFCDWTSGLDETLVATPIEYANSAGTLFHTPTWQILLHVVNHGTGHRGQVNGLIRQAGGRPFNTDLVQFYRSQG